MKYDFFPKSESPQNTIRKLNYLNLFYLALSKL